MVLETSSDIEISRLGGQLAESLSFNRSIGQIYALLYVTPHPLSLEESAKRLSMSKGNASINVRILESWGAVRPVALAATRRDHYEANRNLKELALRRVEEGLRRRLDMIEDSMNRLGSRLDQKKADPNHSFQKKQLQEFTDLVGKARKAFNMMPKLLKF